MSDEYPSDWQELEELLDDWDLEEAANLIASYIPELNDCRVYIPSVEDVLPDDMDPDDPYVVLDLEDVYRLQLRPELEFLREKGIDLPVMAYAV